MVHNNKVLTVSYGTFSCTLEGFEDSFDTMKAIAEYFRDLAADDRYFGAEPPQPDAEMLARIAQREIARQVEARTSEEGIHLRAASTVATPASVLPGTIPATASETQQVEAEDPIETDAPSQADEPSAMPVDADMEMAEVAPHDVVTEEQETEHPVSSLPESNSNEEQSASSAAKQDPVFAQLEDAPTAQQPLDQADLTSEHTAEASVSIEEDDLTGSDAEAEIWGVKDALTDASAAEDNEDVFVPEPEEEPTPVAESIAQKLQRIRAVVAKSPAPEEDFTEDQHAEAYPKENSYLEEAARDLEDMLSDDADGEKTQPAVADAELPTSKESDADDLSATSVMDQISDQLDEAGAENDEVEEDHSESEGRTDALVAAIAEAVASDVSPESTQDAQIDSSSNEKERIAEEELPAEDTVPQEDNAEPAPRQPRGRVIRVRRAQSLVDAASDVVDATASDVEAEVTPDEITPEPIAQPAARVGTLSDEDEADLMAELAAVEADLRAATEGEIEETDELDGRLGLAGEQDQSLTQDVEQEPTFALKSNADEDEGFALETLGLDEVPTLDDGSAGMTEPTAQSAAGLLSNEAALDGDLSRLMAEADDKLGDAESAESRETYNQLRAAVAAAQADKDVTAQDSEEVRAQAYREDLASAVRPRRPVSRPAAKSGRPGTTDRPAPLQLVAEQRIDAEEAESSPSAAEAAPNEAAPVRPRRVTSGLMGRGGAGGGDTKDSAFEAFAREQGAVELIDLLEAAASYLIDVEGRENFTRPQLLGKVRGLDAHTDLTREDSLRAFGQLLRDGKIDRSANGRFTTNSLTGFSGDRAAG